MTSNSVHSQPCNASAQYENVACTPKVFNDNVLCSTGGVSGLVCDLDVISPLAGLGVKGELQEDGSAQRSCDCRVEPGTRHRRLKSAIGPQFSTLVALHSILKMVPSKNVGLRVVNLHVYRTGVSFRQWLSKFEYSSFRHCRKLDFACTRLLKTAFSIKLLTSALACRKQNFA